MSVDIDTFWQSACTACPELVTQAYRTRSFGGTQETASVILDLIRSGEKTGTFAVDWEFGADPAARPRRGDCYVVTDLEGRPGAVIRITETEVLPFDQIGERHAAVEGASLRAVEP